MGGEWEFSITNRNAVGFDHETYHKELYEFQAKVCAENVFENDEVIWAENEAEAIQTNIFATFQYDCTRHQDSFHKGKANWKLYWDPTKVVNEDQCDSNVHARCAPYKFIRVSVQFQEKLCELFPEMFSYELGDGISGYGEPKSSGYGGRRYYQDDYQELEEEFTPYTGMYRTGNGDSVWAHQGEQPDYTACDKECGYCGRCQY